MNRRKEIKNIRVDIYGIKNGQTIKKVNGNFVKVNKFYKILARLFSKRERSHKLSILERAEK